MVLHPFGDLLGLTMSHRRSAEDNASSPEPPTARNYTGYTIDTIRTPIWFENCRDPQNKKHVCPKPATRPQEPVLLHTSRVQVFLDSGLSEARGRCLPRFKRQVTCARGTTFQISFALRLLLTLTLLATRTQRHLLLCKANWLAS